MTFIEIILWTLPITFIFNFLFCKITNNLGFTSMGVTEASIYTTLILVPVLSHTIFFVFLLGILLTTVCTVFEKYKIFK